VKAVLDIPDDLAAELERQAKQSGRATTEQLMHLVRLAMLVEELPLAEMGRFVGLIRALADARNRAVHALTTPVVQTDPVTGLQVIVSPPDAPIHSMTAEQFQALVAEAELEGDLERAGLSVRH
jgi:hypothetical protein